MDIRPDVANVIRNGEVESVAPDTVKMGETILINGVRRFRWTVSS